jgi:hypothetical protein
MLTDDPEPRRTNGTAEGAGLALSQYQGPGKVAKCPSWSPGALSRRHTRAACYLRPGPARPWYELDKSRLCRGPAAEPTDPSLTEGVRAARREREADKFVFSSGIRTARMERYGALRALARIFHAWRGVAVRAVSPVVDS